RDGPMRCAKRDEAKSGTRNNLDRGRGHQLSCGLELASQPIHVLDVVVRTLAVLAPLVMTGSAGEIRRHAVARNRAVWNPVTVHILVATPLADLFQGLGGEQLPTLDKLVRG